MLLQVLSALAPAQACSCPGDFTSLSFCCSAWGGQQYATGPGTQGLLTSRWPLRSFQSLWQTLSPQVHVHYYFYCC